MTKDEWDPFQELIQLRKRFSELFERSFIGSLSDEQSSQNRWVPPVDVYHNSKRVIVNVEIPGMKKDDIQIEYREKRLEIRGNRQPACKVGQAVYHRVERQYGPFERKIDIRTPIDLDHIEATYDNGLLTVTLPIRSGPLKKKINVAK
jgi:HSP20 family protein